MKITTPVKLIAGVLLLVVAGGLLFKGGFSSSPETAVKSFYQAVNDGNLEKAKDYIAPDKEVKDFVGVGSYKVDPSFLAGLIGDIEIEGKSRDAGTVLVSVKLIYKSELKEKAESGGQEYLFSGSNASLEWRKKLGLEKWNGKWKIVATFSL